MELTHAYNHKSTPSTLMSIGLAFVRKYSPVFKALGRAGAPYGDNWLATDARQTPKSSLSQLAQLQERLDELNQNVTLLRHQLNTQSSFDSENGASDSSEVGINRFRALQTEK